MIITGILLSFISVLLLSSSAEQIGYADDNAKFAPISNRLVERNSYDAWGNLREPQTHKVYDAGEAPALMLGRGFTGHEHLQQFGLINMNARLYDPALGRFLSPDPYVQSECGPQGFNRYSYCLNNPLSYVDEDGEFPFLLAGALIGGAVNLVYKACSGQIHSAGDAFFAFGIGAMAGITGVATGGLAFGAAGGAALGGGGFLAGAAAGGLGSAAEMFVQGLGNNLYFGDPMVSIKDLLIGSAIGAFAGGVINGSVAASESKNFWTGDMIADGRGTFSIINKPKFSGNSVTSIERGELGNVNELYHYTSKEGYSSINESQELRPSIGYEHARYGNGQYLTDLKPENYTAGQVSRRLYRVPWNVKKYNIT